MVLAPALDETALRPAATARDAALQACMWTGDASGFMGCDDCDGKCVVRSNSSDISIGAQARIMQDSLCMSMARMIHLFAGSGDASADDMPKVRPGSHSCTCFCARAPSPAHCAVCLIRRQGARRTQECPTEQDIKAVYPTIEQMAKASASAGDEDQMAASLMVHLESEGSLIKFFADKCESGTIALDMAGASVSRKTCVNKGGATMAAFKCAFSLCRAALLCSGARLQHSSAVRPLWRQTEPAARNGGSRRLFLLMRPRAV